MRASSALAVALWLVTLTLQTSVALAITVGQFLEKMLAGQPVSPENWAVGIAAVWGIIAITVTYSTAGLLLALRAGRLGWVLLAGGLAFGTVAFGYVVGGLLVLGDPSDPLANAAFVLGPTMIPAGYALILPALGLAFPHGRLPSRRWRGPVWTVTGVLVAATAIRLVTPGEIAGSPSHNPFGIEALPAGVRSAGDVFATAGLALITVLAVAAVIVRYRRAAMLERQQLRWFMAAVLLAAIPVVVAPNVGGIAGPVWALAALVGLLLVPVSVWIAITRYHLYQIDRLISRTVGWAAVTAILVAVFAMAVVGLQAVLADVTQGQTLAVAASTLAAAALFQPVRSRVQRTVDARFDRARYNAERTAAAFGEQLRDRVALEEVASVLAATTSDAVRPSAMAVWLRNERRPSTSAYS